VRHVLQLARSRPGRELSNEERRKREILGLSYFWLSVYALLLGDEEGIGVNFAAYNAALPLGPGEILSRVTQNVALIHHVLGRYRWSEQLIGEAHRMAGSEADRAAVLVSSLLMRQSTQVPAFAGQKPVHEYEADVIAALGPLATRSRAQVLNVARVAATTTVWQFAQRFRDRPEVTRWAESMRGTVHYTFVQGGAAVMALIAGDRARSEQARARALEAGPTPFYRAWLDANFAWTCSLVGERALALECLRSLRRTLPTIDTRTATAMPVLALGISAVLGVEARGCRDAWLRELLELCVGRLERRRRLPPYLELALAVGRLRLGRGSVRDVAAATTRSRERWQIEQALAGHADALVAASLALRRISRRDAEDYARAALEIIDERYPPAFAAHVRELLQV
jgi:hypothetical protein